MGIIDAAAVLRALNEMFETGLSFEELAQIGVQVDSDVPYCVYSRTALVSGRGEIVTPLTKLPKMWFVLAKPHVSVSTPKILKQLATTSVSHPPIDELLAGIENQDYDRIVANIGNSLEEITTAGHPQIKTLKSRLIEYGADGSQMSGSGPTVLASAELNPALAAFTIAFPASVMKPTFPSRNAIHIRSFKEIRTGCRQSLSFVQAVLLICQQRLTKIQFNLN